MTKKEVLELLDKEVGLFELEEDYPINFKEASEVLESLKESVKRYDEKRKLLEEVIKTKKNVVVINGNLTNLTISLKNCYFVPMSQSITYCVFYSETK